MNNDSPFSTSDPPPVASTTASDEETPSEESEAHASSTAETELQRRLRIQLEQRNTFLDRLIRNLDIMIYLQLSILYYMEYASPMPSLPTNYLT